MINDNLPASVGLAAHHVCAFIRHLARLNCGMASRGDEGEFLAVRTWGEPGVAGEEALE